MRTIETEVYKFAELSEEAKRRVLDKLYDINLDHEWWDSTIDDADRAGLILNEFDLYHGNIDGTFKWSAEECAGLILADHGEECETYKTASEYMKERGELVTKYSDGKDTERVAEDNEYEFDCDCDELDKDFLRSILEDYRIILDKEQQYLSSEEVIIETIEANEYEFTIDGKMI